MKHAHPPASLLALLALGAAPFSAVLAGCTPTPPGATAPSAEPAVPAATSGPATAAPRAPTSTEGAPIVTPAACRAAGLPPLTISTRPALPMVVAATPDGQTWLRFSGPPGGPLGLEVRRAASESSVLGAEERGRPGFAEGKAGKAQKDGVAWSVRTWVSGGGMAASAHLAMWRRIGEAVVVLEAVWGAREAPEPTLDAMPRNLRDILDGLTITAAP